MIDAPSTIDPQDTDAKPARNNRNIVAVASGKGGVGKTWLSITLSHALAKAGKKVLLFDGDLGLANVDVQLGLMVNHDITDVVEGNLSIERVIHRYEDGGFDVVAGRSGQGALSILPPQQLTAIIRQLYTLAEKYDIVIVDLGAGIDRTVRFFASAAGTNIVVCTDEPTSLTDAYAFIKLNHASGHADNIHVVVNMATTPQDGERTYSTLSKACQTFLKMTPPSLGYVRQDRKVKDSIRAQTPYLTKFPNGEAAMDIEGLAEKVTALVTAE